jgi:L-alanine-DL-glutamate epimerase-like enolase superfamily enzyme
MMPLFQADAPDLRVTVRVERWPIAGTFVIARGAKTEAVVVVAEVTDGVRTGRGECVPYARYGESVESVGAQIETADLGDGDRQRLRSVLAPGAARNALDCALWDLEAKRSGEPAWRRAGLASLQPVETAFTLSLGNPEAMAEAAGRASARPLLKLKLGGDGDPARVRAVRQAVPAARLVVDANEAWTEGNFAVNMRACADAGVELIEQPLPAGVDALLAEVSHDVPICADESLHTGADLEVLAGRYDAINIKLDKTGGLTEALELLRESRALGLSIMVGCMVGTSLGMAPAFLLAQMADFVDLDGPLLLARDREPGLVFAGSTIHPPSPELWG